MIKKVSSWVLGSFFRQFGRFLFFLVLGGLVFLLIQHNNINFKWTDLLGIETIKADTYVPQWHDIIYNNGSAMSVSNDYRYFTISPSTNYGNGQNIITTSNGYLPKINGVAPTRVQLKVYVKNGYPEYTTQDYHYYNSSIDINGTDIYQSGITFNLGIVYLDYYGDNIGGGLCQSISETSDGEYTYYTVICNILQGANYLQQINWKYTWNRESVTSGLISFNFGIFPSFDWIYSDSSIISGQINNQSQQQAEQHNETMQFFNDSNTTSDINTADSFFSDTNSTSESALVDIVSTPLTLLNNLSTGTFTDICATLNNKQICLPSGDIIWNRQHGGAGVHDHWFRGGSTQAFITFFNLVVGGFILYKCLISLFHSVHKMLDPTQTYVEVMKL